MKPNPQPATTAAAALDLWGSLVRDLTRAHGAPPQDHDRCGDVEGSSVTASLRKVGTLDAADRVRLSNDAGSFRVVSVEWLSGPFAGLCKVFLRSDAHGGNVMLIRSPSDLVRVMSRAVTAPAVFPS